MQAKRHAVVKKFLLTPQKSEIALCWAFFTLYFSLAALYYVVIVTPYLAAEDMLAPRLLADSITYTSICPDVVSYSEWYWLRDAGPCLLLTVLQQQTALVSLFNVALLIMVTAVFGRSYQVQTSWVLLLLLVNPMTFLSLFGPNKEVFGLTATMCLLIFLRRHSLLALVATLVLSFFARVSMFAAVLLFLILGLLFVRPHLHHTRQRFLRFLLISVTAFSAIAYFMNSEAQIVILGDVSSAEDNSQSTLLSLQLDVLNTQGMYFITYVIRLLLNLYSALANVVSVSLSTHGVYYVVGVIGSSQMFLIMTVIAFRRPGGLLKINEQGLQISLFVVFYTLTLCLSPVIQHRYFFPLYPILVLAVVTRRIRSKRTASNHENIPVLGVRTRSEITYFD